MPDGKHIEQGKQVKDASLLEQETKAGPERNRELLLLKQLVDISQEQLRMLCEREEREKEGGAFGALFGAGDRITAFNLAQFLPRDFLLHRGFQIADEKGVRGADYRNPAEFGEGVHGYERWLIAIFGNLWEYRLVLDEGIRTFVKGKIIQEERLKIEDQERLHSLTDGLFFVHNYNLAWLGCNGDTKVFTAFTREGGVISSNEKDRLGFKHLKDQCRLLPGMGQALSLTDEWAAKQKYDPKLPPEQEESPEDFCHKKLSPAHLKLSNPKPWEIYYQKELALAWYRLLGGVDTRNYQEKHRRYTELMPTKETDLKTKEGQAEYKEAIKFKRWTRYDSPFALLLDPLALFSEVQESYLDIIKNIRVGIREFQSKHNILNLGWRPSAWLILEKIAGMPEKLPDKPARKPLTPEELEEVTFATIGKDGNKTLADLTDSEWNILLEDLEEFQKTNIKNALKASNAQEALAKCFSLNPQEFANLHVVITSYLRTDNPEKDGIWTKSSVLPMITKAITEILESMVKQKIRLAATPVDIRRILWTIEFLVAPAVPFSEAQKEYIVEMGTPQVVGVFKG